ncbi:MAG TPA: hypothetical protein VFD31_08700 [Thermoleophilaceae bacterium]|nr:hypothetical protein [Thermoleophilaceae bacterium]
MSSQAGSREDGRRLSLRTLVIASAASCTAAVVTSLFWKGGTPIAAAVTPVLVAVVSEMLHRPATVIAARREQTGARKERLRTSPATAAREERLRTLPATAAEPARSPGAPEMKVYRAPSRRPRLAFKPIAATAAIAFVIAAALLTLPELIAGQSFGQGDRGTTLFGGSGKSDSSSSDQETQGTQPQPQQTAPDQPDESQSQDTQDQTTPTKPPADEPAPDSRRAPSTTTPAAPAAPGEPAP